MNIETLESIAIVLSIACAIGVIFDALTSGEISITNKFTSSEKENQKKKPMATYRKGVKPHWE